MRHSDTHILTSQAGSLPRPNELVELNRRRQEGEAVDPAAYAAEVKQATAEVVRRQAQIGIDVPGDGEYGKAMSQKIDYGAWWSYSFQRLGGLSLTVDSTEVPQNPPKAGNVRLTTFARRRDWTAFAEAYADPDSGVSARARSGRRMMLPVCTGPLTYTGQEAIKTDIANFKAALAAAGVQEGFMASIAPGSASRIGNTYYASEEEFVYACADAMREEYRAIVDAGLVLQLDDPGIAENWDMITPAPSVEDYQKFSMVRVEALNHALKGLPQDRLRFHLCWGSWHGPHTTDIPMRDIVTVMLAIDVGAYSFEAGNVRHEHEWKVWEEITPPAGKILMPGVVSHATNVIEHPELVADRIERFAKLAGRENVIAGTDCGLGGRIHPQLAWAKLQTLAEGAALATKRLWR
ncbi:MAG TPA: cobalamin-independent methionine synthase II family protein [Dehalococcoidia bacterium]|nr:cobalamin-independent methionine synthase II family protein [Dehalococcoidia bacterium]